MPQGVVVYGFDYPDRSLEALIDAFEALALRRVQWQSGGNRLPTVPTGRPGSSPASV